MNKDKPERILKRVNDRLVDNKILFDGIILNSKRGVPYLWLSHNDINISVCYFLKSKCLKIWTGCGTASNKYIKTVKEWTECSEVIKNIIKKYNLDDVIISEIKSVVANITKKQFKNFME